jgi:hypothetical protein
MSDDPTPSAPSSIACRTSACMASSSEGVGARSSHPTWFMRTVVAPTKEAMLVLIPFFTSESW